jgi:hypothetical protein
MRPNTMKADDVDDEPDGHVTISITTKSGHTSITQVQREIGGARGQRRWEPLSDTMARAVKDARSWITRNGTP